MLTAVRETKIPFLPYFMKGKKQSHANTVEAIEIKDHVSVCEIAISTRMHTRILSSISAENANAQICCTDFVLIFTALSAYCKAFSILILASVFFSASAHLSPFNNSLVVRLIF